MVSLYIGILRLLSINKIYKQKNYTPPKIDIFTFPNSGTNPCHLRDVRPHKMDFFLENFPSDLGLCPVWNIYILVGNTSLIYDDKKKGF